MQDQNIIICKKCSSVNDYRIEQRGIHQTAFCKVCDSYIKNLPQGKPALLYFGKYKEREIQSMVSQEEVDYLKWLVTKPDLKPNSLRESIEQHLTGR